MKEIYYVYNNEAIASCIFLSTFNHIEELDIARSCLILPFLLDDRIVNHLLKNDELELQEMINEQPRLFVSFNKRYLSLLPVTINALMLLDKGKLITIKSNIIANDKTNFQGQNLGERFVKIEKVMPIFLSMIKSYSTEQLYKTLNIQL